MDSNDRNASGGITILAKATSIEVGDARINIVDTPGTPISAARWSASSAWWMVHSCGGCRGAAAAPIRGVQGAQLGLRPIG